MTAPYDADHSEIGMGMMSQMSDQERYRDAKKLMLACPHCNSTSEFEGVFRRSASGRSSMSSRTENQSRIAAARS